METGPPEGFDGFYSVSDSGASATHPCTHPDGEDPKGQRHLPAATLHALAGPEVRGGILEGGRGAQGRGACAVPSGVSHLTSHTASYTFLQEASPGALTPASP